MTVDRSGKRSDETVTFASMCADLNEEAEAIGWFIQRMQAEKDVDAKAIMADSLGAEFEHFTRELEVVLRSVAGGGETAEVASD